ncbi:MAG: leucyl/phenylalanyl-tRNA--protein transferase [Pontixanthobacter sp.]
MHAPTPPLIPADMLLLAYRSGIFPMADSRDDPEIFWVEPKERAIIPLDSFTPSKSLRKIVRQDRFTVTLNTAFAEVMEACAQPRPDHPESWISHRIAASYAALHDVGHAHSVECWDGETLAGGLYGVSFDRVFCGESMFSRADNASKVALVWLVALLKAAGYCVLDCQFMTSHLASMGAVEIGQDEYVRQIADARGAPAVPLHQAYSALVGDAAEEGAAEEGVAGDGAAEDGVATGFGLASEAAVTGAVRSSPGKRIAQSFTHTS